MKFKAGDRVRIRSLQWYLENKDENGEIRFSEKTDNEFQLTGFAYWNSDMCGQVVTIDRIYLDRGVPHYRCSELFHRFEYYGGLVDEMLEPEPVVFEYCIEINGMLEPKVYYTEEEVNIAFDVWKTARPMDEIRIRVLNL